MFFVQDIQINDLKNPAEIVQTYKISQEQTESAIFKFEDSSSAIYKHEVKKPKIITPQTTTISPIAKSYAIKLKVGNEDEKKFIMENINSLCSQNVKESIVFSDTDISDALFEIINEDISKLKKPSRKQLHLRKAFNEGKELTQKQKEIAFSYSEKEKAEQNKILAFYTLGTIQNLIYRITTKKTGITPKLQDSPIVSKIIYEAKNNKDENMRASAIGTLHMIARPEYNKDLKPVFQSALSDKSKIVKDMAKESLQYME